jgi:predicted MFS family arabinose efflux permease
MSTRERFILGVLAAVNFTHIVDVMIMMPLGDIFMRMYEIGPQSFSLLVSAYAFGAFLSSLLGAMLIDRYDRRHALLFVYAGFSLGTLCCALAPNFEAMLALRFLTGIFGGFLGALVLSVASDVFPYERRGMAMGVLMSAFSVASAAGVPLGLYFASQWGWEAPFLMVGGMGVLLTAAIAMRFPSLTGHIGQQAPAPPAAVFGRIARDANQLNALALGMAIVLGHMVIIPFIAPYMLRNVGFEQADLPYIYALGGILTAFTSPLIGRLTDRLGPMRTFAGTMVLSAIPVLVLTNLPPVSMGLALAVTTAFFVLGSGRMIAPQTMITAAVGPEGRGGFMGVKAALQQLAIGVASLLGGAIIAEDAHGALLHYGWVGAISVAIGLASIALGTRLRVAPGNRQAAGA